MMIRIINKVSTGVFCTLFLCSLMVMTSCDDMFDPAKENDRKEEAMYEESQYANGLLMYGYGRIANLYRKSTVTDVATDDAVYNVPSNAFRVMATGSWTSDEEHNPMSWWNACKDGIQYINLFLAKVDKVKWAPSAESKQQMFIDRLKGEALGLRAIFYYHLLQAHGGYADDGVLYGVPLLTVAEDGSSDYNQPRATFADCMKQIFEDCDNAIALLPADYVDIAGNDEIPEKYLQLGANYSGYNSVFGSRSKNLISGKIVEAVKAQAALLAASPAFREQSGVSSADAAVLCANLLKHIGGLEGVDPTGNIWYKNKTKLEPGAPEMPEIIWRADRSDSQETELERDNFPPSLYGSGRVNPTQNLVDAFPMRNGLPITDSRSGYDPKNPYANRDPRLAHYVLCNGTRLKSSAPAIITGLYPNDDGKSYDNLGHQSTSTVTGYYLLKLLRDDVNPYSGSLIGQPHIYPRIRATEIFLAYAEAANDAWGPKSDPTGIGFTAYDVIKAIRTRAGLGTNEIGMPLPEGDAYLEECAADQAKMTDLIRNERRLELCFENKRFWDMRRWLLPLNEPAKGMQIERNKETSELTYTIFKVEDRDYDNSYQCYGPIPKSEILRWSNLKQNKGWQ